MFVIAGMEDELLELYNCSKNVLKEFKNTSQSSNDYVDLLSKEQIDEELGGYKRLLLQGTTIVAIGESHAGKSSTFNDLLEATAISHVYERKEGEGDLIQEELSSLVYP